MPITLPPPQVGLTGGTSDAITPGTGLSVPPGVESILEYRGGFFNVRDWLDTYVISEIDGLADPDLRDAREVNPGRDGETAFDSFYGGRTITLTGKIRAQTLAKLRDMQQGMKQVFSDSRNEYPLIFHGADPSKTVFINCKKIQPIAMREAQQGQHFHRDFMVALRASNPRFLSMTQKLAQWTGFISDSFGTPGVIELVNHVPNPSFERNVTGWGTYSSAAGPTIDQSSAVTAQSGGFVARYTSVGTSTHGEGIVQNSSGWTTGLTAGTEYTFSGYVRSASTTRSFNIIISWRDAGGVQIGSTVAGSAVASTNTGWTRVTYTATAPANATQAAIYIASTASMANGEIHYFDAIMCHPGAVVATYFDGSTGSASTYNYVFAGVPHASVSYRFQTANNGFSTNWTFASTTKGAVVMPDGTVRFAHSFSAVAVYTGFAKQGDQRVTLKVTTQSDITQTAHTATIMKATSTSSYLYARLTATSGTSCYLRIYNSAGTQFVVSPAFSLSASTNYWLQSEIVGDVVSARLYAVDPVANPGAASIASCSATLTGADAAAYGDGVLGDMGFRMSAAGSTIWNNDFSIDDWRGEPVGLEGWNLFTALNEGNYSAQPVVEIAGPVTNPKVTFVDKTNNKTIGSLQITGTVPAGETWAIDIDKRTMRRKSDNANRFSYLDIASGWPELAPGENTITADGSSMDYRTTFYLSWRDTWI